MLLLLLTLVVGNSVLNCSQSFILDGSKNSIVDNANSWIGNGINNIIQGYAFNSVILGGINNEIKEGSSFTFLGPGVKLSANGMYDFVGSGYNNQIGFDSYNSIILGGENNSIDNTTPFSFIGNGAGNHIGVFSVWSTIIGGRNNLIVDNTHFSTVAGHSLISISDYSLVTGQYNKPVEQSLLVIGNGKSGRRSNALVVHTNGQVDITVASIAIYLPGKGIADGTTVIFDQILLPAQPGQIPLGVVGRGGINMGVIENNLPVVVFGLTGIKSGPVSPNWIAVGEQWFVK